MKKLLKKMGLGPICKRLAYNRFWRSVRLPFLGAKPVSNLYGLDRGHSLCRYYIENFLQENSKSVRGRCLEIRDNSYTLRFGGNHVTTGDVLDLDSKNSAANIIGDLKSLPQVADNTYDCLILTQIFQYIDNVEMAIKESFRILKPGGTLLATVPSVSKIDHEAGLESDFWRFTVASSKYLFSKAFSPDKLEIASFGNAGLCADFILGFSQEEVSNGKMEINDPIFPLIVTIKAKK